MYTPQLEQHGLQIIEGLQLLVNPHVYFIFRNHMVRTYFTAGNENSTAMNQLVVEVYSKQNKTALWSDHNRNLLHCCKTVEEAIDFILQKGKVPEQKEEQRFYGVSGNWDQIQKHPELCTFDFQTVGIRQPNRAVTFFTDKVAAKELYVSMNALGMVAMKDWLD